MAVARNQTQDTWYTTSDQKLELWKWEGLSCDIYLHETTPLFLTSVLCMHEGSYSLFSSFLLSPTRPLYFAFAFTNTLQECFAHMLHVTQAACIPEHYPKFLDGYHTLSSIIIVASPLQVSCPAHARARWDLGIRDETSPLLLVETLSGRG